MFLLILSFYCSFLLNIQRDRNVHVNTFIRYSCITDFFLSNTAESASILLSSFCVDIFSLHTIYVHLTFFISTLFLFSLKSSMPLLWILFEFDVFSENVFLFLSVKLWCFTKPWMEKGFSVWLWWCLDYNTPLYGMCQYKVSPERRPVRLDVINTCFWVDWQTVIIIQRYVTISASKHSSIYVSGLF